jgi:L-fucose isomerase-like protein
MGVPDPHWPKPGLDLDKEIRFYESQFAKHKKELADVDFVVNRLISSPEQVEKLKDNLKDVDGILAIHLTIWIGRILDTILEQSKPTIVFAAPYSGHEWVGYGERLRQEQGSQMECLLTSDYSRLEWAVRPFRAIHHLREAKILNLTTRDFSDYAAMMEAKFGTEIKRIELDRMLKAYEAVSDDDAQAETQRWIRGAEKIVEPSKEDIYKSCKLALAFERLLDEEEATVMTVDCYGSMWDKGIKLPAYPCVGFGRLNNMGWGGICESDLRSAMTHILFQGLTGKPAFISDATVDEGKGHIILAHCLGTPKMDGPDKPAHSYKLRTIMEREEGVVPQVKMRIGQSVTQGLLMGENLFHYFTGEIDETLVELEHDRGCRTKIAVKVDGDLSKLWRNWSHGLHRQTVYGDIAEELRYFCKFMDIDLFNEAV